VPTAITLRHWKLAFYVALIELEVKMFRIDRLINWLLSEMTADGVIEPTTTMMAAVTRGSYSSSVRPHSVVLRSREVVLPLVSAAVDVFWQQCRRYGEAWDQVVPPQTYLDQDDDADDDDMGDDDEDAGVCAAVSRRVHRLLIFDLVAEILRDFYDDDDVTDSPPLYDDRCDKTLNFRSATVK